VTDQTVPRPAEPGLPPSLGEILHRARQAGGERRRVAQIPPDWPERDPRLRELDEEMAAAVAERAVADALPELAALQAFRDSVERRARAWAALPDGELRRAGAGLLRLLGGEGQERGEEEARDD
jgi:hypothetical protein